MVVFRKLLKALLADNTQTKSKARTFLTSTTAFPWSAPHHNNPLFRTPSDKKSLSPGPGPGPGPLFLTRPPWKLSQSATPLYLRGNAVVFPKVHPFNLLRSTTITPPLRFPDPVRSNSNDSSLFHSFVNLPNFISLTRLISGPILAWYTFIFIFIFILKLIVIMCWFHFEFCLFAQDDLERVVYFSNGRVGIVWWH